MKWFLTMYQTEPGAMALMMSSAVVVLLKYADDIHAEM
jgi:hypothetical protein